MYQSIWNGNPTPHAEPLIQQPHTGCLVASGWSAVGRVRQAGGADRRRRRPSAHARCSFLFPRLDGPVRRPKRTIIHPSIHPVDHQPTFIVSGISDSLRLPARRRETKLSRDCKRLASAVRGIGRPIGSLWPGPDGEGLRSQLLSWYNKACEAAAVAGWSW